MIGKILWLLATLLLAHVQLAEAQQPAKFVTVIKSIPTKSMNLLDGREEQDKRGP